MCFSYWCKQPTCRWTSTQESWCSQNQRTFNRALEGRYVIRLTDSPASLINDIPSEHNWTTSRRRSQLSGWKWSCYGSVDVASTPWRFTSTTHINVQLTDSDPPSRGWRNYQRGAAQSGSHLEAQTNADEHTYHHECFWSGDAQDRDWWVFLLIMLWHLQTHKWAESHCPGLVFVR